MSGILLPPSRRGHECTPPLAEVRIPMGYTREGRAISAPSGQSLPPALGSQWGCRDCGRVWVVVADVPRYKHGYGATSRRWVPATRRQARQYRARILTLVDDDVDAEVLYLCEAKGCPFEGVPQPSTHAHERLASGRLRAVRVELPPPPPPLPSRRAR